MEGILRSLTSGDTHSRLVAVENVTEMLENKGWPRDAQIDTKTKLMSHCINMVKDANPKIGSAALAALSVLIRKYTDEFRPLANMSFEQLLVKLGDAKASVRELAMDVVVPLTAVLGIASTFERIMASIGTKNQRLKESLLQLIQHMQRIHGSAIRDSVGAAALCSALAVALNDPQSSTRQLAVTTVASLYPVYGEALVDALGHCEIRPAQQKVLLEAIYAQRMKQPTNHLSSGAATHALHRGDDVDPWGGLGDDDSDAPVPTTTATGISARSALASTTNGVATAKPSLTRRSPSVTNRRPAATTVGAGQIGTSFNATTGSAASVDSRSIVSVESDAVNDVGTGAQATSVFDPAGFMHFIVLRDGMKATEIVDEVDLRKLVARIGADLGKKNDWEARTNGLIGLQRLAWGGLAQFKGSVELIRGIHELVSAQIIDLRSAVSKEACRAVGALAYDLRGAFYPLAELFWPHLVRIVVVKIQVIASAADKCLRVLVASCADSRLLGLIAEACTAKSPQLRKLALEYLSLACVCWRPELIERSIAAIKQVLRTALSDSDGAVRRSARQLYWVLHSIPSLQAHVRAVFAKLDPAVQRNIQAESGGDSQELSDLLRIQADPSAVRLVLGHHPLPAVLGQTWPKGFQPVVSEVASNDDLTHSAEIASEEGALPSTRGKETIRPEDAPSADPYTSATALKPSRRLSLSAGPLRVAQTINPTDDLVSGGDSGPKGLSMQPTPANRRQSMAHTLRPGGSQLVDSSDTSARAAPALSATVGAATVASLLAQKPASLSQHDVAMTPAPKTLRPSDPSAVATAAAPMDTLTGAATGPSTAYVSRRTSMGGGLADGPKRIIRNVPQPIAAEPAPAKVVSATTADPPSAEQAADKDMCDTESMESVPLQRSHPSIPSAEQLRAMLCSSEWSDRVKALDAMTDCLQRATEASEALSDAIVGSFLDLSVPVLGDPHHKVATDAMAVVQACVTSFPSQLHGRLSSVALALFHRLGDRRQDLRDAANTVLNLLRTKVDAVTLMAAVAPRMAEVPDRMKTALMQFLGAIAPHCEEYFKQSALTRAFLGRMAHILEGPGGVKPSATLTVAARRLVELVYRTAPTVVCCQIAALPFQQQILLKKFLEASVPDIEALVMAATRAEWTGRNTTVEAASPTKRTAEDRYTGSVNEAEVSLSEVSHAGSAFELGTVTSLLTEPMEPHRDVAAPFGMVSTQPAVATPRAASPAMRLSSKQKLFRSQRPEVQPASPSPAVTSILTSTTANPFSPPPPPPLGTPPASANRDSSSEKLGPDDVIRSRRLSPAAMDLEIRVLEYMEGRRHGLSPSENISPNSPSLSPSVAMRPTLMEESRSHLLPRYTHSASSSGSNGTTPTKKSSPTLQVYDAAAAAVALREALVTITGEEVAHAVLESKRAIDEATEEIMQRLSPTKAPRSTPGRISASIDLSRSVTATPSRPSLLPQRSRPSSAVNSAMKSVTDALSPGRAEMVATNELATSRVGATAAAISRPSEAPTTPPQRSTPSKPTSSSHRSALKGAVYTPPHHGAPAPTPTSTRAIASPTAPADPTGPHDLMWLLEHLKPTTPIAVREQASKELKRSIKAADDLFWHENCAQFVAVLLESLRVPPPSHSLTPDEYQHQEFSAKSLLLLARYRGNHLKNLTEVLVDKLCHAAAICSVPLVQSFEVVLSEFAKYDAPRLARAVTPYAVFAKESGLTLTGSQGVSISESPQVRLLALRVICNAVRFFSSAQLLQQLPTLVPVALSSINSSLPDLRKAVVFILVEMYLSVGDSVFPYIASLTPPQRKLMTIYVEKRMNERKNIVASALTN